MSQTQYDKVQGLIEKGIEEGAELVAGGPGRPDGFNRGYFVRPTVFANVNNDAKQLPRRVHRARPQSSVPFDGEDEAVEIAGETPCGLASYVRGGSPDRALQVAAACRAGMVSPLTGRRKHPARRSAATNKSGNSREGGEHGLLEFLELKAVSGWAPSE